MAETRKPRPAARAAGTVDKTAENQASESKAAAAFKRFKQAREAAAAAAESGPTPASPGPSIAGMPPPWAMPPAFSLPPSQPGWMLPQPGVVQPAPLAVGPLGDRLGSTLRLGIDVLNMALAGSLRLLGGMGYGGGHAHCCGCHTYPGSCCGYDCCCAFEYEDCCTPSVGSCCDCTSPHR